VFNFTGSPIHPPSRCSPELADGHLQHSVEEDTQELEAEHDHLWLDDLATQSARDDENA
jgi:methylphosphotriester-DNA--protein-cysteine methyltransferase